MGIIRKIYNKIGELVSLVSARHMGAYASQAAFFFIITLIPTILLLLTMIQFTPITKENVLTGVMTIFPSTFNQGVVAMVNQVYSQSRAVIPITVVAALWSASRGVLSVTYGLNTIYELEETRNYFVLRFRAAMYTFLFIGVLLFSLVLSVFGNRLHAFLEEHINVLSHFSGVLIRLRPITTFLILAIFTLLVYRFLPNNKTKIYTQIPGAIFTTFGWMLVSYFFSIYLEIFTGFTTMYGSLTTIVLIMLWMYFCMYITLYGARLNFLLANKMITKDIFKFKA